MIRGRNRRRPSVARQVIVSALCALVVGCGGGGPGSGGIDGSGFVSGPIQGFGSVIVAGVTFDVGGAAITLDGQPATDADLRLGMIVTVEGVIDPTRATGVANRVTFEDSLEGPVSSVDVPRSRFTALGQIVRVNAATVFDGTTLFELRAQDVVEVSGFRTSANSILATRVELEDDGGEFELTGRIENLDGNAQTFAIGSLVVDFSGALVIDPPPGGLVDGLLVEVFGPIVGEVLEAVEVEVEDDDGIGNDGDELEIQGLVTQVLSSTRFVVNGVQKVRINSATEFEGGTAADIATDLRVEVEGQVDGSGDLVAESVKIESDESDDDEDDPEESDSDENED